MATPLPGPGAVKLAVKAVGAVRGANKADTAVDAAKSGYKSSKTIRKEWEQKHGKPWPKDPKTGKNQDVSHEKAKADGGTDHLKNIKPRPHDEHMQRHIDRGDFQRWGSRRDP